MNSNFKFERDQIRMLAVSAGLLTICTVGSASSESIRLLGFELPILCGFRLITSLDCPGCGLTRALILALHGKFYESYLMHIWGLPLAGLLLAQIPYRFSRILGVNPPAYRIRFNEWIGTFVFLSFLLPWVAKTAALVAILIL